MKILQIIKDICPDKLPKNISSFIAGGAEGEVYSVKEYPDRVIKLSLLYDLDRKTDILYRYNDLEKIFNFIMDEKPNHIVGLHKYNLVYFGKRNTDIGYQDYMVYFYEMDKLENISDDEYKVFHTIISHEDFNKEKNYSVKELKNILKKLHHGLDFSEEDIIMFYLSLRKWPILHNDLHPRNIMKSLDGNFRLIDLDSCKIQYRYQLNK